MGSANVFFGGESCEKRVGMAVFFGCRLETRVATFSAAGGAESEA